MPVNLIELFHRSAAQHALVIRQLDVKVAVLNVMLEEEVYIKPLLECVSELPGGLC